MAEPEVQDVAPAAAPAEQKAAPAVEPPIPPPAAPAPPPISRSHRLRIIFATLCALVSLTSFVWAAIYKVQKIDPVTRTGELPFNEASKAAIDLRVSQSGDLLKVCLLFLGGLGALVIAKRDETRIGLADRPETVMLVCAATALVGSWVWHEFYLNELSHYLLEGARTCFAGTEKCVPDVFKGPIEYLYRFQISFLILGAVQAGITLFSAHRLKEETRC